MKKLVWILPTLFVLNATAQVKKDSVFLTRNDLVGVWQRNYKVVGNGLAQNFRFFRDSTFEVHFSDFGDDVRDIRELKGTYRLVNKKLHLTIRSRVVYVDSKITISESSEDANIFDVTGTRKEIAEPDPKEYPVPIFITVVSKGKIMLDNETYYKLTKDEIKNEGIDPTGF